MKEQEVEYQAGDVTAKGYIVYDENVQGKQPGVLVVHEWWGHTQFTRGCARRVAQAGFVGFAVDLYGNGKQVDTVEEASALSGALAKNPSLMRSRFDAARDLLSRRPNVDPTRIAAIGYCFGGKVVLDMARAGEDLRSVVSFHGILATETPAQPGKVKAKILVLNGADDPFVPKEQLEAFEREMKAAGVDYKIINYPGAKHAFTNPGATEKGKKLNLPLEYNAEIDRKSWEEAIAFLQRALK